MANKLTAAGLQGFDVAAANLYLMNLRDDAPMVEGDVADNVSVWPEWHRMIQTRCGLDDAPMLGEDVCDELIARGELDADDREWFLDDLAGHATSLVEVAVRNERGEIVAVETMPNPHSGSCQCGLCRKEN